MKTSNTSSRAPKRKIEAAPEDAAPPRARPVHAYAPVQTRRAFEAVADQILGSEIAGRDSNGGFGYAQAMRCQNRAPLAKRE